MFAEVVYDPLLVHKPSSSHGLQNTMLWPIQVLLHNQSEKSFQLAMITPQFNLPGYDTATVLLALQDQA